MRKIGAKSNRKNLKIREKKYPKPHEEKIGSFIIGNAIHVVFRKMYFQGVYNGKRTRINPWFKLFWWTWTIITAEKSRKVVLIPGVDHLGPLVVEDIVYFTEMKTKEISEETEMASK